MASYHTFLSVDNQCYHDKKNKYYICITDTAGEMAHKIYNLFEIGQHGRECVRCAK